MTEKRKHADEIIQWANDPTCSVWCRDDRVIPPRWLLVPKVKTPSWNSGIQYAVIPAAYADAWQAYLDGELQYLDRDWEDWCMETVPRFSGGTQFYRRKPAEPETDWKTEVIADCHKLGMRHGWIARDGDGEWWWYSITPTLEDGERSFSPDDQCIYQVPSWFSAKWPNIEPENSLLEIPKPEHQSGVDANAHG